MANIKAQRLSRRIGQSMRDAGGPNGHCKKLQKKLAKVQRKSKNNNRGNGYKRRKGNGGGNNHKTICWYCEKPIGGKVCNWGGHPVHKECHGKCCKKLRKIRKTPRPNYPKKDTRGLLARIFNV